MKNKILGPILLALLIVGSSDVMAEIDPALERDLGVIYYCSEAYMHYGPATLGISMREAGDVVVERAGVSVGDAMLIQSEASMEFIKQRDNLPPVIPLQINTICTYMAGGLGLL